MTRVIWTDAPRREGCCDVSLPHSSRICSSTDQTKINLVSETCKGEGVCSYKEVSVNEGVTWFAGNNSLWWMTCLHWQFAFHLFSSGTIYKCLFILAWSLCETKYYSFGGLLIVQHSMDGKRFSDWLPQSCNWQVNCSAVIWLNNNHICLMIFISRGSNKSKKLSKWFPRHKMVQGIKYIPSVQKLLQVLLI